MIWHDYYAVLGVASSSSDKEIRNAYRRLARECHPDKNPRDPRAEERFKALAEAYRVLSDPSQRARYDRLGSNDYSKPAEPGTDLRANSFFESFFRAAGPFPRRGSDLRYNLRLDLGDLVFDTRVEINVPRLEPCGHCQGETASRPCKSCGGTGRQRTRHRLEVTVPRGVEDGTRLRLDGEGDEGSGGGSPGNLIVVVRIRPHAFFHRQECDLTCQVPVPFPLAILGGEVEVPSLEGRGKLTLPPGTQSGEVLRMRGRGLPRPEDGRRGDVLVTIQTELPRGLSHRMKKLLRDFAGAAGETHYPRVAEYHRSLDSLKKRR